MAGVGEQERRGWLAALAVAGLGLFGCARPAATEPPRVPFIGYYGGDWGDGGDPEYSAWQDRVWHAAGLARAAESAHQQGDHTEAAELYLEAISYDPEQSTFRYWLGREAFEIGECDIAYVALLDFLELRPSGVWLDTHAQYQEWENAGHRLLAELEASGCVSESLLRPPPCPSGTPWLRD